MLQKCYDCGRECTILIPTKLYTVYPASGKAPEYVTHDICPECLYTEGKSSYEERR